MLYTPQHKTIARHIDYYWIVDDVKALLKDKTYLHAFPGITPDMIIVLDGYYEIGSPRQIVKQSGSRLFSFLHKDVILNLENLRSFILIKFKSRALGALQPFVRHSSSAIMQNPDGFSESAFNGTIQQLPNRLKGLSDIEMVCFLDAWFLSFYKKEREGFVVEMAEEVSPDFNLQQIMDATKYSYSTIERHFKRETGLSPKQYQSLRRCKLAVTEICATKNTDWMHYVSSYYYYDQAHFIKDIKRYTKLTPSQLALAPSFVAIRPNM